MRKVLQIPAGGRVSAQPDGTPREDGPFFIACDGDKEERAICAQAGVSRQDPLLLSRMLWPGLLPAGRLPASCYGTRSLRRPAPARSQVKDTPLTVVAGVGYGGEQSADSIRAALKLPSVVASGLSEAGAVMYGSDGCSWTLRQKAVFGQDFGSVSYVECNKEPAKCSAAGVASVPMWRVPSADGSSKDLTGFQPLPVLYKAIGAAPGSLAER